MIPIRYYSIVAVYGALAGLFAGLAPAARAQIGTPAPIPESPQAPNNFPTAINPASPVVNGVPEGDFFTLGDPLKPLGETLADHGVYLKGFAQDTIYSNVSGGVKTGTINYAEAFYGADFNLGKIAGLSGSVVHFSLDTRGGGFPEGVNDYSGSTVGYLQGTGPSNTTRLTELSWDQHLFDDKIRFVVGRTTLANYFATSDLYCQFQVGTCGNIGSFTWSEDSNSTFWPIASWAGEVAYFPTPETYIRVGASESDPFQYSSGGFPWASQWSTAHATGVFVPVETGYQEDAETTRHAGKYDIGFTYDSTDFADPRYNTRGQSLAFAGGTPLSDGSATTIYLQAQKIVWRPDATKPQSLSLFASAQFATSGHPAVQSFYQVGAVLHGTFPGRPNDIAGIDFQQNLFNPRVTGFVDDKITAEGLTGHVSNQEEILEVNYSLKLAPGLQMKPYTAYTWHPDQDLFDVEPDPRVQYAWAVGVQFSMQFNDALGVPKFFRPD